jgi:hypothetical protein
MTRTFLQREVKDYIKIQAIWKYFFSFLSLFVGVEALVFSLAWGRKGTLKKDRIVLLHQVIISSRYTEGETSSHPEG